MIDEKTKKTEGSNTLYYLILSILALCVVVVGLLVFGSNDEASLIDEGWIIEKECVETETIENSEFAYVLWHDCRDSCFNDEEWELYKKWQEYLLENSRKLGTSGCSKDICEIPDRCMNPNVFCVVEVSETSYLYRMFVVELTTDDGFYWNESVCVKYMETLVRYS